MSQKFKKIIAISICALLSGCDVDNSDKRYSTDQVLIDEHGVTLTPSKAMYVDFDSISKAYIDTMTCMGMTAIGPTVEFRSFSFAGLGATWAFYAPVESTIWINIDEDDLVLSRSARTDLEALEHEFIHHILHKNDAAEEAREHSSPFFGKCGPGINTYN